MFKAHIKRYNDGLPAPLKSNEKAIQAKLDNFRYDTLGYFQALEKGTFYYPAWMHYRRKTMVFCDRCNRQNLRACIGHAQFDLCLLCVDELTRANFDCPSRHCHESKFIVPNTMPPFLLKKPPTPSKSIEGFKVNVKEDSEELPDNAGARSLHSKYDNFRFEGSKFYQTIDHGTYYYPAWRHYKRKTSVFCDRCNRQNLRACVGHAQFDLCLLCVDELTRDGFDCPSRHCHESKFINDNAVQFSNNEYVDLNRFMTYQHEN
jgi:hypothetical protein